MIETVESNPTPAHMLVEGQPRVMRSWYDLPVAKAMWGADARDMEH